MRGSESTERRWTSKGKPKATFVVRRVFLSIQRSGIQADANAILSHHLPQSGLQRVSDHLHFPVDGGLLEFRFRI